MRVKDFVLVFIIFSLGVNAQINFSQSQLSGANVGSGVTSLMYGPDGRLYVAEYPGSIKILTVERNGTADYNVTDVEELDGIQTMADHNDDGTSHSSTSRETLGLTVVGTASNPVIYVTSSDFRIGAGSGGGNGDVGLDTNSGVITRFSWNGSTWEVVDLVRGLPRSEENHATNGLEFVTISGNDYLIVASGGHTNAGSPSTNFVLTCEYALSGAVLSVDLTALEALPIFNDNGRSYVYDLPTLDDPTRANANGISDPGVSGYNGVDNNDPFGGNDGLNQAIIVPGGPVQIFSPGYRNAYDLVVTESGALYVTDNGANGGWGGFPDNEGGGSATNAYNSSEPGSSSSSGGEKVNNKDHLQLVTLDIQNYTFGSFYGGHPNPTRANPTGAGLYTDNGSNDVFRNLIYDPSNPGSGYTDNPNIALPANWNLVVPEANPVEGDWRGPGISNPDGANDNPVTTWGTNTNGIDEYTASNFGGVMQGNLLAGVNSGTLRRVELDSNGNLDDLTSNFLSGIGGNALGVTCNSDSDIFPGTIWAGTLNGKIVVFEPQDFVFCLDSSDPSYNPLADYDFDGYTNQDEEQNGTDTCNGGSQPTDFDKSSGGTLSSDLNDTDDDFDGIPDGSDPFQLGDPSQGGSDAFTFPISNALLNDQQGLGGIFGLGMTGLMNNGDTGANWLAWIDDRDNGPNPNDVLGGASGIMTSHMTSGTALGEVNTQEKGYQYGVQVDNSTGVFTVTGGMNGFTGPLRLFENTQGVTNGELGLFIGDGTQSNYIKFVVTKDGFTALQEIGDVPQTPITFTFPIGNPPISGIQFHFVVDSAIGQVDLAYQINGGTRVALGTMTAQGNILTALQDPSIDLAVGFIGTSGTVGLELEGSWDFLNVVQEEPYAVLTLPDIVRQTNSVNESLDLDEYFGDNGGTANLIYTVQSNSNPNIGAYITANELLLIFTSDPAIATVTVRATDQDNLFVEQTFQIEVSSTLHRINTGGSDIIYNGDIFSADANFVGGGQYTNTSATVSPLFQSEHSSATQMFSYNLPVPNGNYEVNLYFAEIFFGATGGGSGGIGKRVFDVDAEGIKLLDNYDINADVGPQTEVVKTFSVSVSDGELNLEFDAASDGVDEPKISAIEVLSVAQYLPIVVYPIADQNNIVGDEISTLGVAASGGNPSANFTFAISGEPDGIFIEPTNGLIYGTVESTAVIGGAVENGSHQVVVTVSKPASTPVNINFNWIITGPPLPFTINAIVDQQDTVGVTVSLQATASGGNISQPFTFSVSGQPLGLDINTATGEIAGIIGLSADLGGPNSDGVYLVTVTAIRQGESDVQIQFSWTVIEEEIDLPWAEDFEDLADGTILDTGVTAWSTSIDQGVWDVRGGLLLLASVNGGSTAVWSSERIAITGHENVTISIDVDDLDDTKESSDYVNVYYKLDEGSLIPFGTVTGNIDLTTFTVSGITGSVLELVVETQVSSLTETYSIDNVNVSGVPTNPITVSSVTISPSTLTVEMGDSSQQITATVNPSNADDTSVFWLSSDDSIATVNQSGFVTPIAIGNASIIVTTTDGGFEAESIVTVTEAVIIPVTGITLSPSNTTMNIGGGTLQLEATILPSNASNQGILWSTSENSVVNVNSSGEVIANTIGTAVITGTTTDGGFVSTATINVVEAATDLPWAEDFEDLADGTILDTGVTAWSTSIDQGAWDVRGGLLLLSSVNGGSTAVWSSERISITGHENITISIDVDDLDDTKESSDYVNVYYKLDDGSLIPFGTVTGNTDLTTFTVSGITGSVLELAVETKVSWSGETYSIDNVNVSGVLGQQAFKTSISTFEHTPKDVYIIYPNPVTAILNIRTSEINIIDFIQIFDVAGRLVRNYDKSTFNTVTTNIHITLDGLQIGSYYIHIIDYQNNRFVKKLLVN